MSSDDINADLDSMTEAELRQAIDAMKASRRRPNTNLVRWLKALGLLHERQGVPVLPELRPVPTSAPPAVAKRRRAMSERSRASARRRFLALLKRINLDAGPKPAEALAEFLAIDFVDSGSIGKFRTIARGIREGRVNPRTVRAAYKAAKKPGVERPGALFTWYVLDRSPGLARAQAARR
jgi:hypothetical protein